MWLRARAGPVRERLLSGLGSLPLPVVRLHPAMGQEAMEGGLDLTATLTGGQMVMRDGLLARPSVLVLAMAERCPPGLAARLAQLLDQGRHALIAIDEGADPSEGLAPALADRLAFFADLDGVAWGDSHDVGPLSGGTGGARLDPAMLEALVRTAAMAGIDSLRAPRHAAAAARAAAALDGRADVTAEDLRLAAELTLAHRATVAPQDGDDPDARHRPCPRRSCSRQSAPPCPQICWPAWPPGAQLGRPRVPPAPVPPGAATGAAGPCPPGRASWTVQHGLTLWPPCAPPPLGRRSGAPQPGGRGCWSCGPATSA